MRTRTVKLLVWSLIALTIFIIALFMFFDSSVFNFNVGSFSEIKYADSSKYECGNGSTSGVKNLDIEWVDGNINVVAFDGNEVIFEEECEKLLAEKDIIHWYNDNGTLRIKYASSGLRIGMGLKKNLTVKIPKDLSLHKIDIESVSAEIYLDTISSEFLNIESVSGEVFVAETKFEKLDLETVSGNCSIIISDVYAPQSIDIETVSGDTSVSLAEDYGFTASIESLSGDISCNLPAEIKKNSVRKVGSGNISLDIESVSGDLSLIRK